MTTETGKFGDHVLDVDMVLRDQILDTMLFSPYVPTTTKQQENRSQT
jgi:hypothetical protein